jgi:hypothetical protein
LSSRSQGHWGQRQTHDWYMAILLVLVARCRVIEPARRERRTPARRLELVRVALAALLAHCLEFKKFHLRRPDLLQPRAHHQPPCRRENSLSMRGAQTRDAHGRVCASERLRKGWGMGSEYRQTGRVRTVVHESRQNLQGRRGSMRETQRRPRKRRQNLLDLQVAASGPSEIRAHSAGKRLGRWWVGFQPWWGCSAMGVWGRGGGKSPT